MKALLSSPMFGLILTILAYDLGIRVQKRFPTPLLNPIIVTALLIGLFLTGSGIPYEDYRIGGDIIHFFLGPLTVALALPLYRQRARIAKHLPALFTGILTGVMVSALSVTALSKVLGFEEALWLSLLPKSLTNPIAAAVSAVIGGSPPLTVAFVIITGITGVLAAPYVYPLMGIRHPVARGTGLGTASHALGTAKAFEFGETEGGISSAAIGLTGLFTTLAMPLLLWAVQALGIY